MIAVSVVVDGRVVATASAPSRYALPDIIARASWPWDTNQDVDWVREEKVKDATGELAEVRVIYRRRAQLPLAA